MDNILPVSIIIPTLNEEKLLPRLLDSIHEQYFQPLEVIVADSAKSTDATKAIARKMGAKVVEGGTVAVGRNKGAAAAKGEIIMFIDADSVLPDKYILGEFMVAFYKYKLDIASSFIVGDNTEPKMTKRLVSSAIFRGLNALKKTHALTHKLILENGACMAVKREIFTRLGGFREDHGMYGEDLDFSLRAIKQGYIYKVLPFKIPTSARRYSNPKKLAGAFFGALLMGAVVAFGLYNKESIVRLSKRLYGDMGGEAKKR